MITKKERDRGQGEVFRETEREGGKGGAAKGEREREGGEGMFMSTER